jgi:hypothetical protein
VPNQPLQKVPIDQLQPGSFVVAVSRQTGDVVIKAAGWVHTDNLITTLKQKGVLEVLIDPSKQADSTPPAVPTPEPAADHANTAKQRVPFDSEQVKAEAVLQGSKVLTERMLQQLSDGVEPAVSPALQQCDKLLQSCQRNNQVLLYLQQNLQENDALLQHSLRCACLMAAFCSALAFDPPQAQQLTLAALLHDCGKVQLAQLFGNEPATEQQALPYSLMLLQQLPDAPLLLETVEAHLAPLAEQTQPAKLLAIVNQYANLQQQAEDGLLPATSVQPRLLALCGQWLDPTLTQQFLQILGQYPPGSAVQLRSGKLALVLENHPKFADKPKIKLFYHSVHKHHLPAKVLDLARHSDDHIVARVDLASYALDLRQYF